jgi:acyl-coenzyme A synthetase/AMP-(fatty) acid ligase
VRWGKDVWPGLEAACTRRGLEVISLASLDAASLDLGSGPAFPGGGHILLTSGTTGFYKAVLMSAAVDRVMLPRKVEACGLNEQSMFCVFEFPAWTAVGYRFSASMWSVGGTALLAEGQWQARALAHRGLSHAVLVPSRLEKILAAPKLPFARNDNLKLFVGGGAMTRNQIEQTKSRITPHLFNWLASTEAGPIAATPLEGPDDYGWQIILPGRKVEIVDDDDRPAAPGTTGRIRILAAGGPTDYFQDEAATQKFFHDGYFYPGDLGVMRADGRMALRGRAGDVINLAGFKLSPAAIEARLLESFGASGVCIVSMTDDNGDEIIHVVFETADPFDQERLEAVLRHELKGSARAGVHFVTHLPRSELGKILRREVYALIADAARKPALMIGP